MATGTLQRMGHEDLPHTGRNIIEILLSRFPGHRHRGMLPWTHSQKSGSDQGLGILRIPFVTGHLLNDKLVKGFILIEGSNHIVPIPPGILSLIVIGKSRRVCIANHIEPMSPPLFTITGIFQQSVDHFSESFIVGRSVLEKGIHFFGCRGQPNQVKGRTPDQGTTISLFGRTQSNMIQLVIDKCVHRMSPF